MTGRDAILYCVITKNDDGLRRLIKEGHDLKSAYQKDGKQTFLHLAAAQGSAKAIELLLAAGADPNASIQGGPTPLTIAKQWENARAIKLLEAAGAK
ncbi:MAG: ankyrin repeat domain-containing protein [Pirellulales bacterium]